MATASPRSEAWIVLPDLQVPYEDKRSLAAVESFMASKRWDGWLQLGDFLDFQELSHFIKGRPGAMEGRLDKSYAAGNAILDRHQRIVREHNPKARFVLIEGNHEHRATAYREEHPELGDLLDVPMQLRLKERGIEWVPSWSKGKLFKLGRARFTHGLALNKYHAATMVQRYGTPIYYGHTHDVMEIPQVLHGNDQTIVGKSLGCLCRYDQQYMKGAPSKWQQAFAIFYLLPDGFYTEHTIRIFKNRFVSPNGLVYDGRQLWKP